MATIVGLDCIDGALLAGDRVVVRDGTVVGSRRHVFGFDGVGAAAVDGDPDAFRRQLDRSLRRYDAERDAASIDAVSRMAEEVADETGVRALVAAHNQAGRGSIQSVDDGSLEERVAARGRAAPIVLGQLETLDEPSLDDAETYVEEAFRVAASREAGTGEDVDTWRLPDVGDGKTL